VSSSSFGPPHHAWRKLKEKKKHVMPRFDLFSGIFGQPEADSPKKSKQTTHTSKQNDLQRNEHSTCGELRNTESWCVLRKHRRDEKAWQRLSFSLPLQKSLYCGRGAFKMISEWWE
jgi:hypothetical protein